LVFFIGCRNYDRIHEIRPLKEISFLASDNGSLDKNISLIIVDDSVHAQVPIGVDINSLIASYSLIKGDWKVFSRTEEALLSSMVLQKNHSTSNDFSKTVYYYFVSSNRDTFEYNVHLTYFTGLPILNIFTDHDQEIKSKEKYISGTFNLYGGKLFNNISGDLEIRGRGNTTWGVPKKPYQIKFSEKIKVMGMPAAKRWVLLANYYDNSLLRNKIAFLLGMKSHLDWTSDSEFCEVFINKEYKGTYELTQKIEASKNKVDVTNKGYLIEIENNHKDKQDQLYFTTTRLNVRIKDPDDIDKESPEFEYIKNYVSKVENFLYENEGNKLNDSLANYVDINSLIDWYIINEITRNGDATFLNSCYMNLKPEGKLTLGPIWDFDIAFGNSLYGIEHNYKNFVLNKAYWFEQLINDPSFRKKVSVRYDHFYNLKDMVLKSIDEYSFYLRYAQVENNRIWNTLGKPSAHPTAKILPTYNDEINYLKNWISKRMDWLKDEFNNW
jgi:hypothetical protein